ncbi:hypothetical protein H0A61_03014 [Koleobacter methoxysyntrophicus]|jgi:hypothetical protein|uniref:Uncharacterized protein n=1 Tax=Koleobacter methoxysyntrophicus TaxID=2751313 RepID=A0A8A0RRH4_9FIRM|nr:hypothetical protein [Koleobacter methoxysyntrophicus]QSQ10604.1 hypothetical protein H0A61_03014 [Koleobacter methoxysyntrophicus]
MSVKKRLLKELARYTSLNGRCPKFISRLSVENLRHLLFMFKITEERAKGGKSDCSGSGQ